MTQESLSTDGAHSPLYTQQPLDRFSNRADDYAKYRPTYPPAAIDLILDGLGQPLTAADIGAGTGISARLIADRGATVWAVEPNAAMRDAATPHAGVQFVAGTAEQTGLPDRCVDLVLCCQSFHWFEPVATLAEFQRILKPTGRVALMWNERDQTDPVIREYSQIVGRAAERQVFDHSDRKSAAALANSLLFTNFRTQTVMHTQALDLAGLNGLVLSASYIPKQGEVFDRLQVELQDLFDRWTQASAREVIHLTYRANVYIAERRSDCSTDGH